MTDVWNNLAVFIAKNRGEPLIGKLDLTRETDLYHDLDMEPKNIARLIEQWAKTFSVDISGFSIDEYYPSAKLGLGKFFITVAKSPFSASARGTLGGQSLTLGMLEEAMMRGKW
ncbi:MULTISPECIES: DUF1493 family protein [unclassified Paraburkholderia]|uniref:DUF1493 family protein n=1 Tax=unclassified Paraburkholderia TaxID=2615204 RepID=UPI002AB2BCA5|nr:MULTISPECIES: DUF1493 family protein [unclassified Paraburkholderia]